MQHFYKACFCCALLFVLNEAVPLDKEDKSDETSEVPESPEVAEGPPDSHEAMNNREINPITKTRQKRSYEFLMGLINNNSRYQVTKDEPAINLSKKQRDLDKNAGASEVLLELMVKIAANPEQWNKVHHLLHQIDEDIVASKHLIENYQNNTREIQNFIDHEKLKYDVSEDRNKKKYTQAEINKEIAITSDNGQPDINEDLLINKAVSTPSTTSWPVFPEVDIVNNDIAPKLSNIASSTARAYPKYFSYHRVTGKPSFLNRNPKAYVAVSVIAPKSTNIRSEEDLELEHELMQLKPWTHNENLKNMESIRSRWIIDNGPNRDKSTTA